MSRIQVISSLDCDKLDLAISRFHRSHPKAEIVIDITTWESVAGALLREEIDGIPDTSWAWPARCRLLRTPGRSQKVDDFGCRDMFPEGFAEPDVRTGRLWPLIEKGEQPSMPVFIITNPRAPKKLARQMLISEICSASSSHYTI